MATLHLSTEKGTAMGIALTGTGIGSEAKCTRCGICYTVCPDNVFALSE